MRKSVLITAVIATFGLVMPAHALTGSELAMLDVDRDGFIEAGAEARALRAAFGRLTGQQKAVAVRFLESGADRLDITALDTSSISAELKAACGVRKTFHLAEAITGVSLLRPGLISTSDKGARFSLNRDNVTDRTSWSVQGAAIFAPLASRCLQADSPQPLSRGALTGYAIAPYLSFAGVGASNAVGQSDLRLGAIVDLQFLGGAFNLQQVQLSPFYRSDFQGQAEIYGASITWTPYHFQSRLNGLIGDVGNRNGVDYQLSGDLEYLNVVTGGNSGLTDGAQHAWVGLKAGVGYRPPTSVDVRFDLTVDAAYDLINNADATLYSAGITTPLGDNAAFDLRYTYGTTRDDPVTTQDGLTAQLRVRF